MNLWNKFFLLSLASFLAGSIHAGSANPPARVSGAWVRATVPAQTASGAFLQITSPYPARLVEVASDAAERVEIHSMTMDQGVMRMRQVKEVELPAKTPVKFSPGGFHLMLMGLKKTLKPGDEVNLSLTVSDSKNQRQVIKSAAVVK